MKNLSLVIFFFSFSPIALQAQQADTSTHKTDSLVISAENISEYIDNNMRISFPDYFVLIGSDFAKQITAPFHLTGDDALKVGGFVASVAVLTMLDEPIQQTAIETRNSRTLRNVSNNITNAGGKYEALAILGLGAYSFALKNEKLQTTTLLASQAYITSGTMESIIKFITGRQRPSYYNPAKSDAEPTFHGPFFKPPDAVNGNHLSTSFPSGHTTVAFATATVFAMQYKNIPWVPIVSYSAAGLIGVSRITENKHWFTDVLSGAVLGYLCGRQVVNNYRHYSNIKAEKKRTSLTFNINYEYGKLLPGFVYKF